LRYAHTLDESFEGRGIPVPEEKVCAACGRRVSADDRYCPGCGISFGGEPVGVERGKTLPGFEYHFVQGLGWGLGLAAAGVIISMITLLLVAAVTHGVR
jgi:hypothetical protein